METVGIGMCWEEHTLGRKFRTVSRTIAEADLVNFINTNSMVEVLFTNKPSDPAKGRLVPASLVFCIAEGIIFHSVLQEVGVAFLQMELDVKNPTFVGDTIHAECEVIESRPSKGRPGLGLVRTRNEVVKQDGTVVLVYTPLRLLEGRDHKKELTLAPSAC